MNDVRCVEGEEGESSIEILNRFNRKTKYTVDDITAGGGGPSGEPAGRAVPTFYGIPLTTDKRYFLPMFG